MYVHLGEYIVPFYQTVEATERNRVATRLDGTRRTRFTLRCKHEIRNRKRRIVVRLIPSILVELKCVREKVREQGRRKTTRTRSDVQPRSSSFCFRPS